MEKAIKNSEVYDLALIGNGIAAQTFLWTMAEELQSAKKSQDFSLAHVFSEKMAPACTNRSCATVSLNGVEEDVSTLGNDLREGYFLFEKFYKRFFPAGIHKLTRTVIATNELEIKKNKRRYKHLSTVKNPLLRGVFPSVEFDSYLIEPSQLVHWLEENSVISKVIYPKFVKNLEKEGEHYIIIFEDQSFIKASKVVFATGAYSKIFTNFFTLPISPTIDPETNEVIAPVPFESKNTIKAGTYLEKKVHLGVDPFYLSIDGHQVLYKPGDILQIGAVTTVGAFESPDFHSLQVLFQKLKELVNLPFGDFSDFKVVTGLRHKGAKRLVIAKQDRDENIFWINGLYKNGFTLSFLAAKRMYSMIFP